ncbi:DUF981 domain-containing protein [Corynebacterium tuscaniense]|uniref:DUF981 domain-containing protein n=1 Tax=Corynebacterium tuscaniense TaxID=302449 RepID=A0A2N6T3E2_9CORY|nr:DUF981 family protein [Corynebacterium tuscaniense]KGF20937.1 hypothetical protein HMPREF2129_09895 [Corynebacterium tuscaniense DNF00037]PMC63826.1 DUF981 domain-containing protein [Corynebacterium tuscaniense]
MNTFFTGEQSPGLIDWSNMPTYNTIMALAVGAGLIAVAMFFRDFRNGKLEGVEGYALTFGALALILFPTGLHMSLTWPLAPDFAFDNIVFGETSLGFSVLLGAAAFFLWNKREYYAVGSEASFHGAMKTLRPATIFIAGLGLALFGIALAGVVYTLFAAPAEEPISGAFADWPMMEASFLGVLFTMVGLGAVLLPFAVRSTNEDTISGLFKTIEWLWLISGAIWLLFGAMNFYTHIGLIVNTM